MSDYQALFAYFGVILVVFVGGLLWTRYRVAIKRRLNLKSYNEEPPHESDDKKQNHVDRVDHVSAASR